MEPVQTPKQGWSVAKQGLAVLAAGAGLGATMDAEAGIVFTDVTPDAIIQNDSLPIDLDADTNVDFTLSHSFDGTTYAVVLSGPSTSDAIGVKPFPFPPKPFALTAGAPIGPAGPFSGLPGFLASNDFPLKPFWEDGTNAYLGLRFDIGGLPHFGWAHLQTDLGETNETNKVTLFGYAYCDQPNQGLLAGQTEGECFAAPVPPGLALLAAGAVAALALNRRKGTAS